MCAQPQALEPVCVNSQQGWQAVKQIGVFVRKIWPQCACEDSHCGWKNAQSGLIEFVIQDAEVQDLT